MLRKRIFISIHYLEIGGAETSLIGLLQALDPKLVEVDLFINDHRGEMMHFIPEWVNVIPPIPVYTMIERPMVEVLKRGFFRMFIARLIAKYKYWKYLKYASPEKIINEGSIPHYVADQTVKILPSLLDLGEYDLAISFLDPPHIVQDKVCAKKKIEWIHTDFSTVRLDYSTVYPRWAKNDYIVSISEDVTTQFVRTFPDLKDKIIEMENILSPDFVRRRANEEIQPLDMPKENGITILLTVGRFSYAKRMDEIPTMCRKLIEKGHNVKWYIIGYGSDEHYIRKMISKENMQDRVILLGKRTNPYPYIKACDWYIQPSRWEGKSVTVREAQILHRPVIITNYPTASSQIEHKVDGVIVPMPIEECVEAMSVVLSDKQLHKHIIQTLSCCDYGNMNEVDKLYKLLEL